METFSQSLFRSIASEDGDLRTDSRSLMMKEKVGSWLSSVSVSGVLSSFGRYHDLFWLVDEKDSRLDLLWKRGHLSKGCSLGPCVIME